jgi:hypothetical protein
MAPGIVGVAKADAVTSTYQVVKRSRRYQAANQMLCSTCWKSNWFTDYDNKIMS